MWRNATIFVLGLAALAAAPRFSLAETAQQAFARGEDLLVDGDFKAALAAYADAVRADRDNDEYLQKFLVVRRVINLRQQIAAEKDAQRWQYAARALRSFYSSNEIHGELLAIDTELHRRVGSAATARMLADTQLAMNRNEQAVKTLTELPTERATASTQSLLAVALARQGKRDQARRIVAELTAASDAGPRTLYSVARAYAAVGDEEAALANLKLCFEAVAPSILDGFKAHVRECAEFTSLADTDAFAEALKTDSKVHESKCSSGKSCAGCPMRGQCPSGKQ